MKVFGPPLRFDPIGQARDAESKGFDGVRVIDHFAIAHASGPLTAGAHPFISLGAAAAVTTKVVLTQTMMCTSFRNPAEVAQAIATLDVISNGRAELGLGAGWFEPEHVMFGYSFGSPGERLRALEEAAIIIKHMLRNRGIVDFEGEFYRAVSDVEWPVTPHVPDLLIGGSGPRLLKLAARVADRVDILHTVTSAGAVIDADHRNHREAVANRLARVREESFGRSSKPALSATVFASLARDRQEASWRRVSMAPTMNSRPEWLAEDLLYVVGTGEDLLNAVSELADLGVDRVHLGAVPPEREFTSELISEILPELQAI